MWRYLAGAVAALLMVAAGMALFSGRARNEPLLPAMPAAAPQADEPAAALPDSVPAATAKTREQRRFGRYDKDKDGRVTRAEYLTSRQKAFAKLDGNGDGRLSFDEWAKKTTDRFATADMDKSGSMDAAEFATTAPKRSARAARCACPSPAPTAED